MAISGNSKQQPKQSKTKWPSGRVNELVSLRDLKRGMIIRSKASGKSFVIDANFGDRVTAITSMDITNIDEWEIVG